MKKLMFLFFTIICLSFLMINAPKKATVNASTEANIRYVETCVGEIATETGINYHCDISGSYVKYGLTKICELGTVYPTETIFEAEKKSTDSNTGFAARYVCQADITGLKENTTYYYKVVANTEESAVQSFTTGSLTGSTSPTRILFTTDLHSASSYDKSGAGNAELTKIKNLFSNVNLCISTGDQVDRGGYESYWAAYHNGYTVFDSMQMATIPGNHEYYHDNGADYVSPLYYNQFYNNPDNGPECRFNSTYYFKYNGALIIMIDTIKQTECLAEQREWFKQVVENNPSEWIIVGTHAGCISMGAYASDSKWMQNNWMDLFEEYQVDLCISGHEHIYIRNDLSYQGEKNSTLGVTYCVSTAGTYKSYTIQTAYKEKYGDVYSYLNGYNYCSNIITFNDNYLQMQLYDENGKEVEGTFFKLSPKRSNKITSMTDNAITSGTNINYDKSTEVLTINWNNKFYGNVKKFIVDITDENDNTKTYEAVVTSNTLLKKEIYSISEVKNHHIKVTIIKSDGSTLTKEQDIINYKYEDLTLVLDGGTMSGTADWTKYKSGTEIALLKPKKEGHTFLGWYDNAEFTGEKYTSIPATATGALTFYAKWYKLKTITYVTNCEEITKDSETYTVGDNKTFKSLSYSDWIFDGWYDNAEFNGEPYSKLPTDKDEDFTLYAKWIRTYNITYHCDVTLNDAPSSYQEGSPVNLPTPSKDGYTFDGWYQDSSYSGDLMTIISETQTGDLNLYAKFTEIKKSKGCSKKGTLVIELLSGITLIAICLKRKH